MSSKATNAPLMSYTAATKRMVDTVCVPACHVQSMNSNTDSRNGLTSGLLVKEAVMLRSDASAALLPPE